MLITFNAAAVFPEMENRFWYFPHGAYVTLTTVKYNVSGAADSGVRALSRPTLVCAPCPGRLWCARPGPADSGVRALARPRLSGRSR